MRRLLATLVVSLSTFGLNAVAQTPDGQTPAQETVCNPLKADGVTKGLYGLCVAFCEAQDFADVSNPITEAELDALYDGSPSGRILASYDKKKQATDPAMPCIKVEEPCPCWSAAELARIDGIAPNSTGIQPSCRIIDDDRRQLYQVWESPPLLLARASTDDVRRRGAFCQFVDNQSERRIIRTLDERNGTLTATQGANCRAQVEARCTVLGGPR